MTDDDTTIVINRDDGPGDQALGVDTVVKDRFVISSVLGRGGMGIVYRAGPQKRGNRGPRSVRCASS